ncbi:hypothetical protein, partial [Symbiobacterium thermophilum]
MKVTATTASNYGLKFYRQGEVLETAFVYPLHGPIVSSITDKGYTWFRMEGLTGRRTFVLRTTGASSVAFYSETGSTLTSSGSDGEWSFKPSSDGTYYAKVAGAKGATVTLESVDGSTPALAYGPVPATSGTGPSYGIPAGQDGWYRVDLEGGTYYGLNVASAASLAVYREGAGGLQEVATGEGPWLTFTTPAAGRYLVKVTATTASNYGLKFYRQGEVLEAAFVYPLHGPIVSSITDKGYTWFRMEGLTGRRTFVLRTTGASSVAFYSETGSTLTSSGSNGEWSFQPSSDGTYYAKVTGAKGATVTLESMDGTTPASAYGPVPAT